MLTNYPQIFEGIPLTLRSKATKDLSARYGPLKAKSIGSDCQRRRRKKQLELFATRNTHARDEYVRGLPFMFSENISSQRILTQSLGCWKTDVRRCTGKRQ